TARVAGGDQLATLVPVKPRPTTTTVRPASCGRAAAYCRTSRMSDWPAPVTGPRATVIDCGSVVGKPPRAEVRPRSVGGARPSSPSWLTTQRTPPVDGSAAAGYATTTGTRPSTMDPAAAATAAGRVAVGVPSTVTRLSATVH